MIYLGNIPQSTKESIYALAVDNGYTGTLAEFLSALSKLRVIDTSPTAGSLNPVTSNGVRKALANKNLVIVGIEVFTSFSEDTNFLKEGVFPMPKDNDESMGGHAVVVVGYDDEKEWFIIRNSWGVEVGDNRYFYLPYAVWDKIG